MRFLSNNIALLSAPFSLRSRLPNPNPNLRRLQSRVRRTPSCLQCQELRCGVIRRGGTSERLHGGGGVNGAFLKAGFLKTFAVSSLGETRGREEGRGGVGAAVAMDSVEEAKDSRHTGTQSEDVNLIDKTKEFETKEVPVTVQVSEDLGQLQPKGADSDVKDGVKLEKTLWGKLGQRINIAAITFASQIILRDQNLAIPHVSVPDIRWIDWKALQERGFKGVIFDKDNTLTAPYALAVWPALAPALQECQSFFSGHIALLSNSAGLYQFDPEGAEANALEERLGIPVIRHSTKKPAGTADDVKKHFGCDPSLLIMVGDRYFTDVVYGNNNGLLTIRSAPLTAIGEPFVVQQVRRLEDAVVERWQRLGVQPKAHPLYEGPHEFIKDPACW